MRSPSYANSPRVALAPTEGMRHALASPTGACHGQDGEARLLPRISSGNKSRIYFEALVFHGSRGLPCGKRRAEDFIGYLSLGQQGQLGRAFLGYQYDPVCVYVKA